MDLLFRASSWCATFEARWYEQVWKADSLTEIRSIFYKHDNFDLGHEARLATMLEF